MKKLMAAVDGSIPSVHAAKHAVALARQLGGEVTLIHVEPYEQWSGEESLPEAARHRQAELARGQQVLDGVVSALEGAPVRTLNLVGSPAEVIADTAMDGEFDLVVVGNKGRGAVSRVLLGSVADRLVHISPRPVMVVR
ncbi:MAG: universal stress protein [Myxococcaceae bacterium]|nr:universal stress protein [Myxococcaceae bacterium]